LLARDKDIPAAICGQAALHAATKELQKNIAELEVMVEEIKELTEMERYTPVVILPSLVVNETLVCVGRFPKKEEVVGWLQKAWENDIL
jgi:hypothetical protein